MKLEMFGDVCGTIDGRFVGTSFFSEIFSCHFEPKGSSLQSCMLEYLQLLTDLPFVVLH